jgi:glycosyltransferase involved in cell wall biosynthesis
LVDVILPTRNRYELTLEAAGSVLAQTFQDWKLWIVDDASDDGSLERLRGSAGLSSDPRIEVLTRDNRGGPASARQTGLQAGQAPWVALIDSDDRWEPQRLGRQLAGVRSEEARDGANPVDAAFAWYRWRDETGKEVVSQTSVRQWKRFPFITNNFCTLLLRRSVLEDAGGFVVGEPLSTCENLDLCLRLTSLDLDDRTFGRWGVIVVPEVLATCFAHSGVRTSDLFQSRVAAEEMATVVQRSERMLRSYPEVRARLLAQAGGRHLASRQYLKGFAAFGRALVPRGDRKGTFVREEVGPILHVAGGSLKRGILSR